MRLVPSAYPFFIHRPFSTGGESSVDDSRVVATLDVSND
jgi:hypothetical protein